MTENHETVVLTDGAGTYYAVPRSALDGFRVAEEHRDSLEAAIGTGDVQGFCTLNTTRANIKSSGSMTSLGVFNVSVATVGAVSTPGLVIKEQGLE